VDVTWEQIGDDRARPQVLGDVDDGFHVDSCGMKHVWRSIRRKPTGGELPGQTGSSM
jgi:hypothetical protein